MGAGRRSVVATFILAGAVAGTVATLAQVLLWVAAGEDAWTLLLRDARLAAALVRGNAALSPSADFDGGIMLTATGIHLALSVIYAALLLPVANSLALVPSLLAGAVFGALVYFVNLHGLTVLFPWIAEARGGITLVAHLTFGMGVMLTYRCLDWHTGRSQTSDFH